MTKKEWEKIVDKIEKYVFNVAIREHKRGDRLREEFFLGYAAGIKFCKQTMKDKNIIPEFDYEIMIELENKGE